MSKKNLILICVIFTMICIFAYLELLLTVMTVFTLATMLLFSIYGFIKGFVFFLQSNTMIHYYHFRLNVLNNNILLPVDTDFVAPLLSNIKKEMCVLNKKEATLLSSEEQKIITSFIDKSFHPPEIIDGDL